MKELLKRAIAHEKAKRLVMPQAITEEERAGLHGEIRLRPKTIAIAQPPRCPTCGRKLP